MTEIPITIKTGKGIAPIPDWEQRGIATLHQFFDALRGPTRRLVSASDHYLHSYAGEFTPGVSSSLGAHIKNTADTFRNTAGNDEILKHMVTSADTLTKQVENQLQVIRGLTSESSDPSRKLSNASKNASGLLNLLFASKDLHTFNGIAQALTTSLAQEVSNLRNGATSGLHAAQKVAEVSNTERETFGAWWRSNYKEGYFQTIPHYQQSLRAFAETAQTKKSVFDSETSSVFHDVPNDAHGPFMGFVNDYRTSRFPQG